MEWTVCIVPCLWLLVPKSSLPIILGWSACYFTFSITTILPLEILGITTSPSESKNSRYESVHFNPPKQSSKVGADKMAGQQWPLGLRTAGKNTKKKNSKANFWWKSDITHLLKTAHISQSSRQIINITITAIKNIIPEINKYEWSGMWVWATIINLTTLLTPMWLIAYIPFY